MSNQSHSIRTTPPQSESRNSAGRLGILFRELRERRVYRAVATYCLTSWVILQGADVLVPLFGGSTVILQLLACVAMVGLPVVVMGAWMLQWTPRGFVIDDFRSRAFSHENRLDAAVLIAVIGIVSTILVVLACAIHANGTGAAAGQVESSESAPMDEETERFHTQR